MTKVVQILKKLTPERIEKEIKFIQSIELPIELQKWVKEYEKVGKRKEFLWKWIYNAIEIITFPVIPNRYRTSLYKTKFFILSFFTVVLNDIADHSKNRNLLNELLKIPFNQNYINLKALNKKEKKYFYFSKLTWNKISEDLQKLPFYKLFKEVFYFDILQIICANEYDYLINKKYYFLNKNENLIYAPYTMAAMLCVDLDLICLKDFNLKELGIVREITWHTQKMARIGNWISSWERELYENDFSSEVFTNAKELKLFNPNNLKTINKQTLSKKIKKSIIEENLLKDWQISFNEIQKLVKKVKSVNFNNTPKKMEKILLLDLSTINIK